MKANLDHLVFGAADLEAGVAELARLTGVTAQPGGHHAGFGTRNALTGLGGAAYLEVIAPDPEQTATGPMRTTLEAFAAPALVTWAVNTDDLDGDAASMEAAGIELAAPIEMERAAGDVVLRWRIRPPLDNAGGAVPFLIDWADAPHPATTLRHDLALRVLHITTPLDHRLTQALTGLGVDGVEVRHGEHAALRATISGPRGTLSI
jgi:Glyoxalase-like domain